MIIVVCLHKLTMPETGPIGIEIKIRRSAAVHTQKALT